MPPALEARVIRLEELCYFQEEKLKNLDAALTAQQSQIDELGKEMKALRQLLEKALDEAADSNPADKRPPEVPPHIPTGEGGGACGA